jgi:hypothetical protein
VRSLRAMADEARSPPGSGARGGLATRATPPGSGGGSASMASAELVASVPTHPRPTPAPPRTSGRPALPVTAPPGGARRRR